MAKKARRARLWAEGITVLVLVLGVTMAAIVRPGSDNAPATSDAPTFVPGNTESKVTTDFEPAASLEPDARLPLACKPVRSGLAQNGAGVVATFDGAPLNPARFCASDWDIAVSSRDQSTFYGLEPMSATHGEDCSPPPDAHTIRGDYEDTVFSCRDHLMTAINAEGYGVVYLTPAAMVDFSGGEAVIKFDVSTFRASGRDWIDVWVTPWADNLQLPLDDYFPDLQGEPRRAIHVKMDGSLGDTHFKVYVITDFGEKELPLNWGPMEKTLTPDEKRRDTFELRISRTHIAFGLPAYKRWWVNASMPDIGWDLGVVQFGQHSYNPTKDPGGHAGTWHWDNISISPARPFTMVRPDFRYADTNGQKVSFAQPAPADAHLRFSAVGSIELSFDGGETWVPAERQAEEVHHEDHFSSYWTPIPKGTASVMVRGGPDDWFDRWFAKDFSIWSQAG